MIEGAARYLTYVSVCSLISFVYRYESDDHDHDCGCSRLYMGEFGPNLVCRLLLTEKLGDTGSPAEVCVIFEA